MQTVRNKIVHSSLALAIVMTGLFACNDNSADKNATTTSSSDTVVNSNSAATNDSSKNAVAKTKRTGKASVTMPVSSKDKMIKDKDGVYNRADVMPEFPGGQDALANYVENNLNYPQQAIDDNTMGTVRISFVVDANGKVIDPRIVSDKKIGNGLDEEALKVVNQMPTWKPGKVRGKNVKTRLELPITFQLSA